MGVAVSVALVGLTLALVLVERQLQFSIDTALATERDHVGRARSLRAITDQTYVALLERWIRPGYERTERAREVSRLLKDVHTAADRLADAAPVSPMESQARAKLVVAAALFSNRVLRAVINDDGPAAIADIGDFRAVIAESSEQVLESASAVGQQTDTTVATLRRESALTIAGITLVSASALAFATMWQRQKRKAEERLRAANAARRDQEHAERVRSRFYAHLSHELRTPILAIKNLIAQFDETGGSPMAARLRQATDDLLHNIDNVLDAAKLEMGAPKLKRELADLGQIVRRSVRRCEGLVGTKEIRLELQIESLAPIVADVVKLHQVVTNLVANAIKFTHHGTVTVRVARHDQDHVRIEVEDTGIGIPEDAFKTIWEPFKQGDDTITGRFGGTGLGLSIVKGIVSLHGGSVSVRSTLGSGSCFSVILPVTAQSPAAGATPTNQSDPPGPMSSLAFLTLAVALLGAVACTRGPGTAAGDDAGGLSRVTVAGSSALLPVVTDAANRFMKAHPGVAVEVTAGGSRVGLDRVARGEVTIGTSDVASDPTGAPALVDHRVAIAGFAAMAHRGPYDETIDSLSMAALKGIFTGTIRNWSEVGGTDQPIVVINRGKESGTRITFGDIVLGGDQFIAGREEESSGLVQSVLEQTPGAISYLALTYRRDTLKCFSVDGVAPSPSNIASGKYPIWSYEHMYTLGLPRGPAKAFLDFVLSADIQRDVVGANGLVPMADLRGR
jgi:phosphate transport system substrate-binding protein